MALSPTIIALSILLVSIRIYRAYRKYQARPIKYQDGFHVVISGGSKGIGKALAERYASLGADVTIIARNIDDLEKAKKDIEKKLLRPATQKIEYVALDLIYLSFPRHHKEISENSLEIVQKILGRVAKCDILINCCGNSIPAKFDDMSQDEFKYMMNVNYFSAVNLTRLLLPYMKSNELNKENDTRARIVFVSSMCGILSFYGFSGYSASKFALVGLAQALNMELINSKIPVTVAFPADTLTPGYEQENKIKPYITKRISETGSVYKPEQVAESIVQDVNMKKFYSTVGVENIAAVGAANAFFPDSIFGALFFCVFATPLRILSFFLVRSWYSTARYSEKASLV